jgi:hypothetical protein
MPEIRPRRFKYRGRSYTVRAAPSGAEWQVRVFENGTPAHGITYKVSHENALDAVSSDAVARLMDFAEQDFKRILLKEMVHAERDPEAGD